METNDKVETSNEQTKKDFRFDDFQVNNSLTSQGIHRLQILDYKVRTSLTVET